MGLVSRSLQEQSHRRQRHYPGLQSLLQAVDPAGALAANAAQVLEVFAQYVSPPGRLIARRRASAFCGSGRGGRRVLDALLPVLYLRGVSTGDFQEVLAALLGKDAPNLSPAVITRLTAEWQADYDAWQKRDLSARRYVYVWADGVYLQARMEAAAECMLVLIGATPEGKKELVGFQTGVRESAQSWRELLVDIKQRGLEITPDLAVGDGALGFWKAIEEVFPGTRHQRCWVHKTANVLNKVAFSVQVNMKADLREIYGAPTRPAGRGGDRRVRQKTRRQVRQGTSSIERGMLPPGGCHHVQHHRRHVRN